MAEHLTIDDLFEVMSELEPAKAQWQNFGVGLKVRKCDLESIKMDNKGSQECLREMLSFWLDQVDPRPTWTAVVRVLRSPAISKQKGLADILEKKYCPGSAQEVPESDQESIICQAQDERKSSIDVQPSSLATEGQSHSSMYVYCSPATSTQSLREPYHTSTPVSSPATSTQSSTEDETTSYRTPVSSSPTQSQSSMAGRGDDQEDNTSVKKPMESMNASGELSAELVLGRERSLQHNTIHEEDEAVLELSPTASTESFEEIDERESLESDSLSLGVSRSANNSVSEETLITGSSQNGMATESPAKPDPPHTDSSQEEGASVSPAVIASGVTRRPTDKQPPDQLSSPTNQSPDPPPSPANLSPDPPPSPANLSPDPPPSPANQSPDPPPSPANLLPDPPPSPTNQSPEPPPSPGPANQPSPARAHSKPVHQPRAQRPHSKPVHQPRAHQLNVTLILKLGALAVAVLAVFVGGGYHMTFRWFPQKEKTIGGCTPVDSPDKVINAVRNEISDWRSFGDDLSVSSTQLDRIKHEERTELLRLKRTVRTWYKSHPEHACWEDVVHAIKMENQRLARTVAEEHGIQWKK